MLKTAIPTFHIRVYQSIVMYNPYHLEGPAHAAAELTFQFTARGFDLEERRRRFRDVQEDNKRCLAVGAGANTRAKTEIMQWEIVSCRTHCTYDSAFHHNR